MQFWLHENANPATRRTHPWLLDVQSSLLDDLRTVVVVPLVPLRTVANRKVTRLTPVVDVQGEPHILMVPLMAGIDRRYVGRPVPDLSFCRDEIVGALDFLISGV